MEPTLPGCGSSMVLRLARFAGWAVGVAVDGYVELDAASDDAAEPT